MPVPIDAGGRGPTIARSSGVQIDGAQPSDTMRQAGRSLSNFAERQLAEHVAERKQQEAEADKIALAKANAEVRLDWQQRLDDRLSGYDGAEAGFSERIAGEFEADARERLEAVPGRIRGQFEADLIRYGERITSSAITGESGKRQSYIMGGLRDTLDAHAMSVMARPDGFPDALEGLEGLVAAAPPGLQDAFRDEGGRVLVQAYSDTLLEQDPAALVDALAAGQLDAYLEPRAKASLEKQAKGALAAEARAAEREQAAAIRQRDSELKSLVSRVVAYENAGLPAPPELIAAAQDMALSMNDAASVEKLALARYKRETRGRGTGGTAPAKAALDTLEDTFEAGLMPSAEMIATAEREVATSGSEKMFTRLNDIAATQALRAEAAFKPRAELQAELDGLRGGAVDAEGLRDFKVLSGVLAQREKRGQNDNVGWAIDNGARIAPVALDSETLVPDIARRVVQAEALADETGERFQVFSQAERGAMAAALEELPAAEQAGALARLTAGAGGRASAVIGELAETKPHMGQAGYLTATGRGETAVMALEGAALLKQDKDLLGGTKSEWKAVEEETLGLAIPLSRGDVREGVVATARGIYAAEMARQGKSGEELDRKAYEEALQTAVGKSGAKGGIGKVNKRHVQLPAHMSASEVKRTLKAMSVEDWTAFSLSGASAPSAMGPDGLEPLERDELKGAYLLSVGEGRYQISLTDPSIRTAYVLDGASDAGAPRPFVLDLNSANAEELKRRQIIERAHADAAAREARASGGMNAQINRGWARYGEKTGQDDE